MAGVGTVVLCTVCSWSFWTHCWMNDFTLAIKIDKTTKQILTEKENHYFYYSIAHFYCLLLGWCCKLFLARCSCLLPPAFGWLRPPVRGVGLYWLLSCISHTPRIYESNVNTSSQAVGVVGGGFLLLAAGERHHAHQRHTAARWGRRGGAGGAARGHSSQQEARPPRVRRPPTNCLLDHRGASSTKLLLAKKMFFLLTWSYCWRPS